MQKFVFLVAAYIFMLVSGASAEAPAKKDANGVVNKFIFAKLSLYDMTAGGFRRAAKPDLAVASKSCDEAAAIARRFDPNPLLSAQVDLCFAMVAGYQGQKASSCQSIQSAEKKANAAVSQGVSDFVPAITARSLLGIAADFRKAYGC
ncbi:MAG TPA: hypothetical protein VFW22_05430 [Pseudolabrys sp.]|nr:hypothetical protein [Pseudolabrys sp.]